MCPDQSQSPKYPDLILNLSRVPVDSSARAAYVQRMLDEISACDVDEFIERARGLESSELTALLDEWVTLE